MALTLVVVVMVVVVCVYGGGGGGLLLISSSGLRRMYVYADVFMTVLPLGLVPECRWR